MVASGATNREIAERLVISPKTACSHVEHILAKLGAARLSEIATWVSRLGRAVALCITAYVVFSIGWPILCAFVLLVAFSMAELTSAFPTAGGPYWWEPA